MSQADNRRWVTRHEIRIQRGGSGYRAASLAAVHPMSIRWIPEVPLLPDTSGPLTVAQCTSAQFPLPPLPGADQTPPSQPLGRCPHLP